MKKQKPPIIIILILAVIAGAIYFWKMNNQKEPQPASSKEENGLMPADVNYVIPEQAAKAINDENYQIIDIRPKKFFDFEHIESSISYPVQEEENLENFSENVFPKDKKIIIVSRFSNEKGAEIVQKLDKKGYSAYLLQGGIEAYYNQQLPLISAGDPNSAIDKAKATFISVEELVERVDQDEIFQFLDVRRKNDFEKNRLEGSLNIPLEEIEKNKKKIPIGKIVVVDENPVRSFQAAVKLNDMNIWGVFCLSDSLSRLKELAEKEENQEITAE